MRKTLALLLVLSLVVFSAFAGGEKEEQSTGPVKLQVWYAMSGDSGTKVVEIADRFNVSQQDIVVELTYSGSYADSNAKISAAMLSGTNPDVAITAAAQLYTGGRGDYRMEEYIKDPEFDVDDVLPGMLAYGTYEGRQGAVPYGISTQVMYYNADILKAAGIDMTNPPATWEEFLAVALEAQKKGNVNGYSDFYGFDTSDSVWLFKSMLSQNGNPVVSMKGNEVSIDFADGNGVEVAEFWSKLISSGVMPASQHDNAEKKFLSGNVAFIAASSNRVARWQGNTEFELAAMPMPYFQEPSVALGGNVITILTSDEKRADAGWEFIKFMLQAENQTEFAISTGYLPVRKSGLELDVAKNAIAGNAMYQVAFDQLDYAWAYTHFDQMGTMDTVLWTAIDELEKGVKTPAETLDSAKTNLLREMD